MNPSEFSKIISRFSGAPSKILLKRGVWVDRLIGDQIIGMSIPYYVGGNHQFAVIEAAKALLRATGTTPRDLPNVVLQGRAGPYKAYWKLGIDELTNITPTNVASNTNVVIFQRMMALCRLHRASHGLLSY